MDASSKMMHDNSEHGSALNASEAIQGEEDSLFANAVEEVQEEEDLELDLLPTLVARTEYDSDSDDESDDDSSESEEQEVDLDDQNVWEERLMKRESLATGAEEQKQKLECLIKRMEECLARQEDSAGGGDENYGAFEDENEPVDLNDPNVWMERLKVRESLVAAADEKRRELESLIKQYDEYHSTSKPDDNDGGDENVVDELEAALNDMKEDLAEVDNMAEEFMKEDKAERSDSLRDQYGIPDADYSGFYKEVDAVIDQPRELFGFNVTVDVAKKLKELRELNMEWKAGNKPISDMLDKHPIISCVLSDKVVNYEAFAKLFVLAFVRGYSPPVPAGCRGCKDLKDIWLLYILHFPPESVLNVLLTIEENGLFEQSCRAFFQHMVASLIELGLCPKEALDIFSNIAITDWLSNPGNSKGRGKHIRPNDRSLIVKLQARILLKMITEWCPNLMGWRLYGMNPQQYHFAQLTIKLRELLDPRLELLDDSSYYPHPMRLMLGHRKKVPMEFKKQNMESLLTDVLLWDAKKNGSKDFVEELIGRKETIRTDLNDSIGDDLINCVYTGANARHYSQMGRKYGSCNIKFAHAANKLNGYAAQREGGKEGVKFLQLANKLNGYAAQREGGKEGAKFGGVKFAHAANKLNEYAAQREGGKEGVKFAHTANKLNEYAAQRESGKEGVKFAHAANKLNEYAAPRKNLKSAQMANELNGYAAQREGGKSAQLTNESDEYAASRENLKSAQMANELDEYAAQRKGGEESRAVFIKMILDAVGNKKYILQNVARPAVKGVNWCEAHPGVTGEFFKGVKVAVLNSSTYGERTRIARNAVIEKQENGFIFVAVDAKGAGPIHKRSPVIMAKEDVEIVTKSVLKKVYNLCRKGDCIRLAEKGSSLFCKDHPMG